MTIRVCFGRMFAREKTVYNMMLTDQRENLHEICAEWYERHFRESGHHESVIMYHWIRSGNTPKKVSERSSPTFAGSARPCVLSATRSTKLHSASWGSVKTDNLLSFCSQ